jgi:hypothetical protein
VSVTVYKIDDSHNNLQIRASSVEVKVQGLSADLDGAKVFRIILKSHQPSYPLSIVNRSRVATNIFRVGSDGTRLCSGGGGLDVGRHNSTDVSIFAVGLCQLNGTRDVDLSRRDLFDLEGMRIGNSRRQRERRADKECGELEIHGSERVKYKLMYSECDAIESMR